VLVCYWHIGHENFIASHGYCYAYHVVFLARRPDAPISGYYPPPLPALTQRPLDHGRGFFSLEIFEMKNQSCSICNGPIDDHVDANGVVYWTEGHNAEPVRNGRCCTKCNNEHVIPKRLTAYAESQGNRHDRI